MNKMGEIIAGVAASAAIAGGAYAYEAAVIDPAQVQAVDQCREFNDPATQQVCIKNAEGFDPVILALEITGASGIIGCGYLGYKRLKNENGGSGIMDDF